MSTAPSSTAAHFARAPANAPLMIAVTNAMDAARKLMK